MTRARWFAAFAVVGGCKQPGDTVVETGPTIGTGWFVDTANPETGAVDTEETDQEPICEHLVSETVPAAGVSDWYWLDGPVIRTTTTEASAYTARLLSEEGFELPTTGAWSESGTELSLSLAEPLAPLTPYRLELTDCSGTFEIPFSTSAYGEPLADGATSLVGLVYAVDLTSARWLEPEAFGALVALYFTAPVLIEVEWADAGVLDLLGAPGKITGTGDITQDLVNTTWDFPPADFGRQPLFEAVGAEVVIPVDVGVDVTIYGFELSGTFSADGRTFAGGAISGLADTRELGQVINDPEPSGMCDFIEALGIACVECPDLLPYCVNISAVDVAGSVVDGLSLLPI